MLYKTKKILIAAGIAILVLAGLTITFWEKIKRGVSQPASLPSESLVSEDFDGLVLFSDLGEDLLQAKLEKLKEAELSVIRALPENFEQYKLARNMAILVETPAKFEAVLEAVLNEEEKQILAKSGQISSLKLELFAPGQMISILVGPAEAFKPPDEKPELDILQFQKSSDDPDPLVTASLVTGEPMVGQADWADYVWIMGVNANPTVKPSVLKPGNGSRLPQPVGPCTPPPGGRCVWGTVAYPVIFDGKDFIMPILHGLSDIEWPGIGRIKAGEGFDPVKFIDKIEHFSIPIRVERTTDAWRHIYSLYHRAKFSPEPREELIGKVSGFSFFRRHRSFEQPLPYVVPTEVVGRDGAKYAFLHWSVELAGKSFKLPRLPKEKQALIVPLIMTDSLTITAEYRELKPGETPPPPSPPPSPPGVQKGKNFSFDVQPRSLAIKQGLSGKAMLSLDFTHRGRVNLSFEGNPPGKVAFRPEYLVSSGSSEITIEVPRLAPPGAYNVTTVATLAGVPRPIEIQKLTLEVVVKEALPDYMCLVTSKGILPNKADIEVEVKNFGLGDAFTESDTTWRFSKKTQSGFKTMASGSERTPPLLTLDEHVFTLNLVIPEPGDYVVDIDSDTGNTVRESIETNNSCTDSFKVADTVPPAVSVSHLPASPTTNQQVTFSATASDSSGIAELTIFVGGVEVKKCLADVCSFTGGPYGAGSHIYHAESKDKAGNSGSSPHQWFNVSTAPPPPPPASPNPPPEQIY